MPKASSLVILNNSSLMHNMGEGHPESPDRVRVIQSLLQEEPWPNIQQEEALSASREQIMLAHDEAYLSMLESLSPVQGYCQLDSDTLMNPYSLQAAFIAAGGAIKAVDAVFSAQYNNAFVVTRPPGHHATRRRSMGFCFFNNAAIAIKYAQKKFHCKKIAIVDFDVHHGNGTQDILWSDPDILFISTHQSLLYPGTGLKSEIGEANNIINIPLSPGAGSKEFRFVAETIILPRIKAFAPEFIVISAGFDAHYADPLGDLFLIEDDYFWITQMLIKQAKKTAGGKIVSVLEGGYNLSALRDSLRAHLKALTGQS